MPYYKTKDGRELYLPEPIFKSNPETSTNPVDEVKKTADHIKVVSEVQNTAAQLVGLERLEKERQEMEKKLEETRQELEKARQESLEKELAAIKEELKKARDDRDVPAIKELEHKLEETREAYHREQLEALRREIAELRKGGQTDIGEEVKKIRATAEELGLKPTSATETPPDILIQLKKMDHDLQLKLEEMRDERDRRDKEWQLTLRQWEEERELRQAEIQRKYDAEKERTETLKSSFDRAVRIIGRALTEEEGEETPPTQISRQYHVEAGEGEMGEFSCPKCGSSVVIAPDTAKAVCAECGFSAAVRRVRKEPVESEEQVG